MWQSIRRVFDVGDQGFDVRRSFGGNATILCQVAAQCVQTLCALTNKEVSGPKDDGARLLRFVFDRDEPHVWPLRRLTDGLGVGGVILLPLHERLLIGRRYQTNSVP